MPKLFTYNSQGESIAQFFQIKKKKKKNSTANGSVLKLLLQTKCKDRGLVEGQESGRVCRNAQF